MQLSSLAQGLEKPYIVHSSAVCTQINGNMHIISLALPVRNRSNSNNSFKFGWWEKGVCRGEVYNAVCIYPFHAFVFKLYTGLVAILATHCVVLSSRQHRRWMTVLLQLLINLWAIHSSWDVLGLWLTNSMVHLTSERLQMEDSASATMVTFFHLEWTAVFLINDVRKNYLVLFLCPIWRQ